MSNKTYSVKNEASQMVAEHLRNFPIIIDGEEIRKSGLIAELKYYTEERAKAGRPLSIGEHRIPYDDKTYLDIKNELYRCRIVGIGERQ